MIVIQLHEPGFGVEPTPVGGTFHFQDRNSGITVQIPADSNSLATIAEMILPCLTDDQKKALAPKITGGIILPNGNDAAALGQFPDGPPR